jgi:penicillin-binding protein 1A
MTARERQRRRRRRRSDPARLVLIGFGALFGMITVAVVIGIGYIASIADHTPPLDQLKQINRGASSVVFASDGVTRLGVIASDTLRSPIPSGEIPRMLKDATVAIEDKRFYKHSGVDIEGIIRAAAKDIGSGKALQGGSTITMQLVRNLYIGNQRTFKRKIREAVLAQRLEKAHDKDWILTSYLNTVPYGTVGGQTALGVQAAARIFFNRPARALTLPQAALLAGLPQAPSLYNPFNDPRVALARRNDVLTKMSELGYITPAQAEQAIATPLGVQHGRFYTSRRENFFFDYVRQQLIEHYGANTVLQGGLKIYTTIDLKLQNAARRAIGQVLGQPGDPASAIVSIDPRTGYIRAMAESAQYEKSQFNLASQAHRQPGSTFKTMVLLTALRHGIDPSSTYYTSKPLDFTDPVWGPIKVQTYSNTYKGSENLVDATLQSDNTIYEQLDLDVGPRNVKQTAIDAGVTSHLDGYPAEGLGGLRIGVTPLEMANAYATIASGGWRNTPIAVTRVAFPGGHVDDRSKPKRVKVFSDGVTGKVTQILHQNVLQGTGTAANYGCPAAGKTGTTDKFTDAWFDGYTPHLSSVVWVGYPKGKISMNSVHGIAVAGGTFPAQIWHNYMQVAAGNDCADFPTSTESLNLNASGGHYSSSPGGGPSGRHSGSGKNGNPIDNGQRQRRHGAQPQRRQVAPRGQTRPNGGAAPPGILHQRQVPIPQIPTPGGVPGGAAAPGH